MGGIVRVSTNTPWEPIAGYSRAVRAGDWAFISGTTATDENGSLVGINQPYVQARQAIANLASALNRLGLAMANVVRTRMFVTDIGHFAEFARAHREAFDEARPATTMVEVRRLAHPDMLIEIEADAFAGAKEAHAPAPLEVSSQAAEISRAKMAPARSEALKPKPAAKTQPKAAIRTKAPSKARVQKKPARKPARRR